MQYSTTLLYSHKHNLQSMFLNQHASVVKFQNKECFWFKLLVTTEISNTSIEVTNVSGVVRAGE